MTRFLAFVYGVGAYAIFFLTFLYLIGFLTNLVVPRSVDAGGPAASLAAALLIDLALIALFGLQHSIMARPGFKRAWTRLVPHSIERSTYVLISSLALILLYWQWRPITAEIWSPQAEWAQLLLHAVFWAGVLLLLATTFVIDHFDLFGLRQVTLNLLKRDYSSPPFQVGYFYRFVRHPLYVGWFMMFWGTPRMTLGHLVFAVGMSLYILIAIRYEERDLVSYYGRDYESYRSRTPMLIPRPGKVHPAVRPTQPRSA